jgi:tetratricopeptide (TPR) repeat protein
MAQVAGDELTRGAIYLYETGRARPSRATLELIAARTGKPVSYFLTDGQSDGKAPPAAEGKPVDVSLTVAELAYLTAKGEAQVVLDATGPLLEQALPPLTEARVRLLLANAAVALGRAELGLINASSARSLATAIEGGEWLEAEAATVEVEALKRAGDPSALQAALAACSALTSGEEPPPFLESRLLRAVAALRAAEGDWPGAAADYESTYRSRSFAADLASFATHMGAEAGRQGRLGNEAEATAIYWRATELLATHRELGEAVDAAIEHGRVLRKLEMPDPARRSLETALSLADGLGAQQQRARALLELADMALAEGDHGQAEAYVETAMSLAGRDDDRHSLGLAHLLRARMSVRGGDHRTADAEFGQALEDLEASAALDEVLEARSEYAEALQAQGRVEESLEQWKRAAELVRGQLRRYPPVD